MKNNRRKNVVKLILFILLANLPFLTVAHQLGTTTFLDSFDNAKYYNYMKKNSYANDASMYQGKYLLLQKPSHPSYSLEQGDTILYYREQGGITCDTISAINTCTPLKQYIPTHTYSSDTEPVTDYVVIGKVVGVIDDNIWNTISLKTWEMSINYLNIRALFTNP